MDFALFARNNSKSAGRHCHVYVIFKDLGAADGQSKTTCGGKERIEHVFTSSTHKVEVRVLGRNRNFIVNYTGKTLLDILFRGCWEKKPYLQYSLTPYLLKTENIYFVNKVLKAG